MTAPLMAKAETALALMYQAAAQFMMPTFGTIDPSSVKTKPDKTVLTEIDGQAEQFLTSELQKHFPDDCIIGEESFADDPAQLNILLQDKPVWILDPLDGTYSFAYGQPGWGLMASYVVKGEPLMAVVLDPSLKKELIVIRDHGVFLNGNKIDTPFIEKPLQEQIGIVWRVYYKPEYVALFDKAETYFKKLQEARVADPFPQEVCFVETCFMMLDGSMDFLPSTMSNPWDFLPLTLLLNELGGRAAKLIDGHPFNGARLLMPHEPSLVVRYAAQWDEIKDKLFEGLTEHDFQQGLR